MPDVQERYPVAVAARIDEPLNRRLWLVKWFLAIPHLVVLVVLWIVFVVLTVVAGVSIVFTGRYPRGIFDFNVGVMRWTWRVQLYAFTLVTDRYPPFSLQPDASYAGELEVEYPEQLSRGLVWVKWWLLAIPHYALVAIFDGGPSAGPDRCPRPHRRGHPRRHPELPHVDLRLRHGPPSLGLAGHGLRHPDARRVPTLPHRPRPRRAPMTCR